MVWDGSSVRIGKIEVEMQDKKNAEYVETLKGAEYPDASAELHDIMSRDNFIDALQEDDLRLKVLRPTRPHAHYKLSWRVLLS